jgi:5-(carboxyamino)imidazole ribonucleotide mutase
MPNGVPVATVALNAAQNAGILAAQIIGSGNESLMKKIIEFKEQLKQKIELANQELKKERTKRA